MSQIIADRRALHRIPELDNRLPRTMEYLRIALKDLRCTLSSPVPGSLYAWFDNGADAAIAFRADADALPVQEATGAEYASQIPGQMHACGHDGHMAILLELARRLDQIHTDRNFLLIFQPAEETTGGARDICESGIFEGKNIQAIFGLHLWPGLEKGKIASRKNELMARSCELTAEITGRSSHIAKAEEGLDALLAGVDFVKGMQAIKAELPPEDVHVLGFGKMTSGTVRNAVSAHTRLEGTLRTYRDEIFFGILERLKRLAEEIAAKSGCRVEVTHSQGYPAVMNPPEICEKVKKAGMDYIELDCPYMTTEDFSWYQQTLPGMFFFLGLGPAPALHAADFDFDEGVLSAGAEFFEKLALNYR